MVENYWNNLIIKEVISNDNCKGFEEWLLVENEDSFKFEVFASSCKKFEGKKNGFDFKRFKPDTKIVSRIQGHFVCFWPNDFNNEFWNEGYFEMLNLHNAKKYFVLGKVIEIAPKDYNGNRGRLVVAKRLQVYFIDNENNTKVGDTVLISIYSIFDLRE